MMQRMVVAAGLLLAGLLGACSEKLITPGDCPALCPGGQIVVYDTILTPIPGSDSAFVGYVTAPTSDAMLVANNAPAADGRGYVRFIQRGDSVNRLDTARAYTIDSVKLRFGVLGRDSLQPGITLNVYKLPATMDSSVSFAELDAALTPANFVAAIALPDTLLTDTLSVMLQGTDLARVALTPADSGVLRLGLGIAAPAPTGVRVASLFTGASAPLFVTYITVDIADTALQKDNIARVPNITTYKTAVPTPAPTPGTLLVGGAPSSRVLLRFELPPKLRDSAEFVRATLQLVPVAPAVGVANIPSQVQARAVLADLGAKSPVSDVGLGVATVGGTITDTVKIDVINQARLWRSNVGRPPAIFVSLAPEASSFLVPVFGSTADPAHAPSIRLEYVLPFGFVEP